MPNTIQILNITKDGWDIFFGFLGPIMTLGTGITLGYFAYYQNKINNRLKDLQDYVAIIVCGGQGEHLILLNIGKSNLYLHKYEIGSNTHTFSKPVLISVGGNSRFQIKIEHKELDKKVDVKLYLTDEFSEKYLCTGEATIKNSTIPIVDTQGKQISLPFVEAYTYKTEKLKWEI